MQTVDFYTRAHLVSPISSTQLQPCPLVPAHNTLVMLRRIVNIDSIGSISRRIGRLTIDFFRSHPVFVRS